VIPTSHESSRDVPHLALPLGGLGTGNVAIHSDGSLRQWQLHNIGNHAGALPYSFFGLRISRIEPPLDTFRVLQAPLAESTNTPLVTDDVAPHWMHDLPYRGVAETTIEHAYPFATVRYLDDELPVDISL
jgi:non-lysosomal glucosylceramidase